MLRSLIARPMFDERTAEWYGRLVRFSDREEKNVRGTDNGLREAAERILEEVVTTPGKLAEVDQTSAEWTEAYAALGVDLTDAAIAVGAFATLQIVLFHLVDVADLTALGHRIIDGATALASFIS